MQQNHILMIDTNQLSALISAFRVETEKESISPETVGKLLQDIVDLLAAASTDAERPILDEYGTYLMKSLAAICQPLYGTTYSLRSRQYMRQFFFFFLILTFLLLYLIHRAVNNLFQLVGGYA